MPPVSVPKPARFRSGSARWPRVLDSGNTRDNDTLFGARHWYGEGTGDRMMKPLVPPVWIARFALATAIALLAAMPSAAQEGVRKSSGAYVDSDPSSIVQGEYTDCLPTYTPLVFDGGYGVSLCYETAEGLVGAAQGGIWASGESGLLWFFDLDNAEVLVKVLNGCWHNGRRWVFVAPVTDVAFNLHVTSSTGRQWTHRNRLGETAATRSDTSAFVCTEDDATSTSVAAGARPGNVTGQAVAGSPLARGEHTDCRPTTTPLVFDGGYQVSLCYETADGKVGEARGGIWASNQSGLLWFFSRGNAEVLVKVLNGCSHNGRRWIFVAPVTDVAFNLHVTSVGGREWTHRNRLGETAVTASDTSAFDCATDDGVLETVSVSSASAEEGDAVEFTVTQSGASPSDTVLGWSTAGGTATSGEDFRAVTAGTLTIAAGETTGRLRVSTVEDTLVEAAETFTVTLTGTMLPPGVALGAGTATGTIVDDDAGPGLVDNLIPDANLRAALVAALGLQSGEQVTRAALETLTVLEAPRADIRDLTGLELATGLTQLNLRANSIGGVSPLVGLTQLTNLDLEWNDIEDLSPLAGLAELTVLLAGYNAIEDVSPLAGLTQLDDLYLARNVIKNVSPLAGLTELENLQLPYNVIEDLSPLVGLTRLTHLDLQFNAIEDVSPLAGLSNLGDLILSGNRIENVRPLSGLDELHTLYLGFNSIENVTPLAGLANLKVLNVSSNALEEVAPLASLSKLQILDLSINEVQDVSPLAGLVGMRRLRLQFNVIEDVSPLVGLQELGELDLRGNPLDRGSIEVHVPALSQREVDVQFDWFESKRRFDIELVFLEDFSDAQKRLVEWASRRWMAVLPEDLPDVVADRTLVGTCDGNSYEIPAGERIDDLRVYVTSSFDRWGLNGWGIPEAYRNDRKSLPFVSCINLDLTSDTSRTALHEFAHALGFTSAMAGWRHFLQRADDGHWHFVGPLAIAAFRDAGGSGYTGPGVPLRKNDDNHWGGLVVGELMGFQRDARKRPLSAITIQALADVGYSVDVTQADEYALPGLAATGSVGAAASAEIRARLPAGAPQGAGAFGGLVGERPDWVPGGDAAGLAARPRFCRGGSVGESVPVLEWRGGAKDGKP